MNIPYFETYKGCTIEITRDEDAFAPSEMDDSIAFVTASHRDFSVEMPAHFTTKKDWWIFPLYAYIHSGVALSLSNDVYPFNDRWDACQVGFVGVKRSEMKAPKQQNARQVAQGLVDAWNQYLSEEVLAFLVTNNATDETVDSCGGFYDTFDYVLSEAREAVCHYRDQVPEDEQLELFPDEETTWDRPMAEHEAEFNARMGL